MIDCPVCLSTLRDAVELGCGHSLCGMCLMRVAASSRGDALCPVCRTVVTHQHPSYAQRQVCNNDSPDQASIDRQLRERFPEGQGRQQQQQQQQQQRQQQRPRANGATDSDWPLAVYLVLALVYFISPVDLCPDFIPIFGQMDDSAVFFFLCTKIWAAIRR
eukprot:TRINITY_DN9508_c0_g1_i2.p1 TRINITY_DN9508_c0_g1~~TRINITY_DN9508_c0_g1_i2.p1  ORF type:complete len:161 (+),score=38.31 TRINITY_DN9508_c0_g1_i2:82-564(+)